METPKGTVVSVETRAEHVLATIEVDSAIACPRCAAGKGCGAGLFSGADRLRVVEAVAEAGARLEPGDTVSVELKPLKLLNAAFVAYGMPLLGAVVAATAAFGLGLGDAASAGASLAGMAVGIFGSRWYLRRPACLGNFRPTAGKPL